MAEVGPVSFVRLDRLLNSIQQTPVQPSAVAEYSTPDAVRGLDFSRACGALERAWGTVSGPGIARCRGPLDYVPVSVPLIGGGYRPCTGRSPAALSISSPSGPGGHGSRRTTAVDPYGSAGAVERLCQPVPLDQSGAQRGAIRSALADAKFDSETNRTFVRERLDAAQRDSSPAEERNLACARWTRADAPSFSAAPVSTSGADRERFLLGQAASSQSHAPARTLLMQVPRALVLESAVNLRRRLKRPYPNTTMSTKPTDF
jgi:hypothetical protein